MTGIVKLDKNAKGHLLYRKLLCNLPQPIHPI